MPPSVSLESKVEYPDKCAKAGFPSPATRLKVKASHMFRPDRPERPTKFAPLFGKIFTKNNWAGLGCYRVEITYSNGLTRSLPPEFKDLDGALRYMARFHKALPIEKSDPPTATGDSLQP